VEEERSFLTEGLFRETFTRVTSWTTIIFCAYLYLPFIINKCMENLYADDTTL